MNAGALFRFDAVAIVGASPRNAFALSVISGIEALGFRGKIVCINPGAEPVRAYPGYAMLADVPFRLGAAVIVVRAASVPAILDACGRARIRSVTIVSAGFAEAGPAGRALQDEVAAIASRHDLAVCGPNCLGFFSLHDGTATYATTRIAARRGDVAVVSQSGGMLNEVLGYGGYRGLGFSKAISSGNEAVLDLADYLTDLVADPHTTTIGAIVEGVRNPERLGAAFAAAARAHKPIVALGLGTSALGAASAVTHTGAPADSAAAFAALCVQHGVTLVEDLEELCEALLAFAHAHPLIARAAPPRGFAAIEISGGGKGLICDLAERYGLPLLPLGAGTVARMRALGDDLQPSNPFDIIVPWEAPRSLALHEAALASLADEERFDVVVSRLTVPPSGPLGAVRAHAELLDRFRTAHPQTFYAVLGRSSEAINPEWQALCVETGLTYLQGYRRGIATLGRLHRYRTFLAGARAGSPSTAEV